MDTPVKTQDLPETATLVDVIRAINADRERLRNIRTESETWSLQWADDGTIVKKERRVASSEGVHV
jgi:hypothetical protein